jgi:prolyl oligopeptidase
MKMLSKNELPQMQHRILHKSQLILATILLISNAVWAQTKVLRKPPKTRKEYVKEIIHGIEIVDPYQWLEDQESPATRAWIDEQNEYTHSIIDPLPGREQLSQRITELMRIDRISMPLERNGRYFLSRRSVDQDLYVIYMREGFNGQDQVLIDPHPMSPDKTTSVSLLDVSKDGSLVAYGIREGGEDEVTVKLFEVDTRTNRQDVLPKGRYFGVSILPDNSGLYYSRHQDAGSRVYYHAMGRDPHADIELFGEAYGPDKGISVDLSEDGRYLLIVVYHGSASQKTEIYFQDLIKKTPIVPIVTDIDARFNPEIGGDKLFIQTNWKAPNGRVLVADLNNPAREHWQELIPETKAVIRGFSLAGGKVFVNYLENVVSAVKVFESDGKFTHDISFPTLGTVGDVRGQWGSNEAFFVFTSFHVPTTIYRYNVDEGVQEIWFQFKVSVNTDMIEVDQVWYRSKDGTRVPMFIVHARGVKLDGNNPTLLTGYGGFNVSVTPYFSSTAVLWVENGGVFAMPNLRGGGEFGEEWHRAGMLGNKQRVFDDFIAAAEWLIEHKYTNPSKLAISGGSNGGLLVGAAITQRPDLFQAVVCAYPLLDMIRYHRFLVAPFWISEYGSSEDPNQFKYIYAYSPYHRVKKDTKYPATLLITGDADTRLAPLHARKMTALLQSATGSDKPVLLLYDTKSGHSGGRPVSKQIEDETDVLSFLFWQLGMAKR